MALVMDIACIKIITYRAIKTTGTLIVNNKKGFLTLQVIGARVMLSTQR
jgi:hypothetical protein